MMLSIKIEGKIMYNEQEILSTIEMVKNEHLDVRAVTLGISLFDCVSHNLAVFKKNIRAKILRNATDLVRVL